jgi:hypothetical protein
MDPIIIAISVLENEGGSARRNESGRGKEILLRSKASQELLALFDFCLRPPVGPKIQDFHFQESQASAGFGLLCEARYSDSSDQRIPI